LLDTNVAIALLENDSEVEQRLSQGATIYLPVITLGELYFGASKSMRPGENIRRVDQLAGTISIVNCDQAVARHYGDLKQELRRRGRPIPENDLWIAAMARRHDLTLVSRDRHFDEAVQAW
jgi:tRNA(fMet)-specific endonuclease VapC